MNLKLIADYHDLCQRYNKSMTWEGLKLFKKALK